jgi:uncharacterized membrane protein YqjE
MSQEWAPAAREVAASLLDVVQTRLDLAATEIELSRLRLAQRGLCLLAGLFFAGLGLVFAAALLVLVSAESNRPLVLALLSGVCLAAAAALAWRWHRLSAHTAPMLQATLEELRKDRDGLVASIWP